ncbi:MAG TPA: ATP-dependent DNA helicase DinG [Burkholderiales bacterium]|nr:ATP-dependent DNA helicase DinG [Burkholderiales bacterium]
MLTDTEKKHLRGTIIGLSRVMRGFKERRPQLKMMGEIALAFAAGCQEHRGGNGEWLTVVEAATGVGKSAAGAAAALAVARERGKRIVVSSSTVALQHQLVEKDLPTLQQALPFSFTFALAKGRGRYACPAKLERAANPRQSAREGIDAATYRHLAALTRMAADLSSGAWSGDRDELPAVVDDEAWAAASTDRHGCTGSLCEHNDRCPYRMARDKIAHADLIVTNHDLLLASLEIGEDGPLPAAAETLFVIDEAHALPTAMVEHLGSGHPLRGAVGWMNDVVGVVAAVASHCAMDEGMAEDAERSARSLSAYLLDMARVFGNVPTLTPESPLVLKGTLSVDLRTLAENVLATASSLERALDECAEALRTARLSPDTLQMLNERLGQPRGRLEAILKTWRLVLDAQPTTPVARWIERRDGGNGSSDFSVYATPISAAAALDRLLWTQAAGVALVSATLSSCDSFGPFLTEVGLLGYPGLRLARLPSPFDYATRAKLIVPRMESDPRDSERHTAEIVALLPKLTTDLGTLLLFSSNAQMRATYERMPEALRAVTLMQGMESKGTLIAKHKARIDAGERSVLMGLQSLAEGVDLPGAYCTTVVIAKLSFAVPTNPLASARAEWVEQQGGSAFHDLYVPETAVRLAQSVGRLLRREDDYGRVVILDKRLGATSWGRRMMSGLPPFELHIFPKSLDAVLDHTATVLRAAA